MFERLPLADFGNRIPQLSFELMRPLGRLEKMTRAVTLIPGTTEFGYEPGTVVRLMGPGQFAAENRHAAHAASDVEAALDDLQATCPNVERVAVVVAWFGSDLRADNFSLTPKVDSAIKQTFPPSWSVAGIPRIVAPVVSTVGGRPAFGGTPSDDSVTHLIQELRARGLKITLYPFVMMDIPAGNGLTDPWTGAASSAGLSLARAHHLQSGARPARLAGRHRGRGDADRCVLRHRRWRRALSPHGAALRAACRGRGRRRCVPDRLGAARADARALGVGSLPGGDAADRHWPPT